MLKCREHEDARPWIGSERNKMETENDEVRPPHLLLVSVIIVWNFRSALKHPRTVRGFRSSQLPEDLERRGSGWETVSPASADVTSLVIMID